MWTCEQLVHVFRCQLISFKWIVGISTIRNSVLSLPNRMFTKSKVLFDREDSTNENNFSVRRFRSSSRRRAEAPNFLGWNSTSKRRVDEEISGSLERNGIAAGYVQSYLWSIATDFVGPPILFRPFNAFAPLAFLDSTRYSIAYRMVKTSSNLFRALFRSSSLSIVFQIENRSVIGYKSRTIFSVNVAPIESYKLRRWQATESIARSFYNLDSKQEIGEPRSNDRSPGRNLRTRSHEAPTKYTSDRKCLKLRSSLRSFWPSRIHGGRVKYSTVSHTTFVRTRSSGDMYERAWRITSETIRRKLYKNISF